MTGPGALRVLASPGSTGRDGNPYVDLLTAGLRDAGVDVRAFDRRRLLSHPQIVHVHWPSALVRWDSALTAPIDAVKVLGLLALARLRGARLVWTAHDLRPHELTRPRLFRLYFALFARMVDLWISLTEAGAAQLERRHPLLAGRPRRVIAHGTYEGVYGARPSRAEADAALGLPSAAGTSYLLLGQLRRYKNATALIAAFGASRREGERLLVVGEVRGDDLLDAEVVAAAEADDAVVLRRGRVAAAAIPGWHAAADVVVLPYDDRSALNSGALLLALAHGIPVVAADSPVNRELRDVVGHGWIHLFRGDAADALSTARAVAHRRPAGEPDLGRFAWPVVVADTVAAYRGLVGSAS